MISPSGENEPGDHSVDDLSVAPIWRKGLPEEVKDNRAIQAERDEADRARFEQAIEAHIAAHRIAVDFLAETHQWIADELDFDLDGETRAAAIWAMSGRCLGIARFILDGLALGYTAELLHLARAEHEATSLAGIFQKQDGRELLRKWLADDGDEWVRQKDVRKAEDAFGEHLAAAMKDAGLPQSIPTSTAQVSREIYGQHSEAAHHRRRWVLDAVSPPLRTMIYGPTDSWLRRAATTAAMVAVVEGCVITVGGCLDPFLPGGWYEEKVKPLLETFAALRDAQPLS